MDDDFLWRWRSTNEPSASLSIVNHGNAGRHSGVPEAASCHAGLTRLMATTMAAIILVSGPGSNASRAWEAEGTIVGCCTCMASSCLSVPFFHLDDLYPGPERIAMQERYKGQLVSWSELAGTNRPFAEMKTALVSRLASSSQTSRVSAVGTPVESPPCG
jgi:hypothetical protein